MAKKINLNDYLGHSMDCTCGKEHKTNLKIVDIDKDAVSRLPKHIEALGYKKPFLVADVNTWAAAGALAAEKLDVAGISYKKYIFNEKELIPDERTLGSLMMAFSRDCDVIVAVGSGTLNDLCKFSSFQLGLDYMVFATAPSMDGFVSIGAALITNYVKTTYQAHVPLAVIGDTDILAAAPMEMITAGLGDILGKYTCLLDWKMAHIITGEYYCSHIADMVKEAVFSIIQFDVPASSVLDLFAGSGQMGIEALSRGASHCVFVDSNPEAVAIVKDNVDSCGFNKESRVLCMDSLEYFKVAKAGLDIVFIDPPYRMGIVEKALELVESKLNDGAIIVCEHENELELGESYGRLKLHKRYKYGKTALTVYKIPMKEVDY